MDDDDTIAVVGGGQSAKYLLIALGHAIAQRRLDANALRVAVYEEGDACGPGLGWHPGQVAPVHHSSLPAAVNRAAEGRREIARFEAVCGFLREHGARITVRRGKSVTRIDRDGTCWRLACAGGATARARHVVLAMGHSAFGTHRSAGLDAILPWPFDRMCDLVARHLDAQSCLDVLVLGSYLTAIDVVTGLSHRFGLGGRASPAGHPLRLHLLSPSGELPKVWGADPGVLDRDGAVQAALREPLRGLRARGAFGLDAFSRVVLATAGVPVSATPGDAPPGAHVRGLAALLESLCAGDPRQRLEDDVREVAPASVQGPPTVCPAWQRALFGCLPLLSESFSSFAAEDQLAFQPLRSRYYKGAMPMSLADASCLRELFRRDLLRVLRGAADDVRPREQGGWMLGAQAPSYGLIVDATGPDTRLARTPSALLRHLRDAGIVAPVFARAAGAEPVEMGGVRVDPATCAVHPPEEAQGMFAMGPLVVGTFPDAQSIGHVARDAERIVRCLCRVPGAFPAAH